jgi:small-conductance mechanosensitive channel
MKTHATSDVTSQAHYSRLVFMIGVSFIAMYVLMYAMVNAFDNVYMNINQVYMAGLMAAPMGLIELVLMRAMYTNRKLNAAIILSSVIALAVFWVLLRQQAAVDDRQFLRSMIPHHAGAILMCEEASIQDPEITALCKAIVSSQQREIDQMKAMLDALGR